MTMDAAGTLEIWRLGWRVRNGRREARKNDELTGAPSGCIRIHLEIFQASFREERGSSGGGGGRIETDGPSLHPSAGARDK